MSYVTAMLRHRARRFAEEASWWKREADAAGEVTRRRITLTHDFAAAKIDDDQLTVDATIEALRVDDARPLAFVLDGIKPLAAVRLGEMLDAIFVDCTKRRVVPYRACTTEIFERKDAARIEIVSLCVPTQRGQR